MNPNKKYQPINCDLYDHLEIWAMRKTPVSIVYIDGNQTKTISNVTILDLKTTNTKEEFMFLSNEVKIRLDQILSINGLDFSIKSC